MVPRLVPEISSLDAFCDGGGGGGAGAGIGDSRSLIILCTISNLKDLYIKTQTPSTRLYQAVSGYTRL